MLPAVRLLKLLLAAPLLATTFAAKAADVSVAVAANFTAPMLRIAAAFERETGHRALPAFGSTGRFYAQIRNGAPFQLLLAADAETPARLESESMAVPGSRFTYATGRLALWSASPGLIDANGDILRQPGTAKVAVADPRIAPYGAAAMQAMQNLGVLPALQPRLVQGESIGQAHQFVDSGTAPMGFVAWSQVQVNGKLTRGSAWLVPATLHAPLRQDAVLLRPGRDNEAALALARFLRGDTARAIIRAHGYEL